MSTLLRRIQYLLRQRRIEAELQEEMEFHRAEKQTRLEQSGMAADEAAYATRRALGNVSLAREDARGVWIWPWLESVWQDFAFAGRSLLRQPGFTIVAGGTLAAAIGLNTSLFTVFSALAWRPWPVPDSDRVVNVVNGGGGNFSYAAFRYFAEHSTAFEGLFAERRAGNNVLNDVSGQAARMRASWVSSRYFAALHVPLVVGRGFADDDDRAGAPAVAVLSHPLWRARFNADPGIVGRAITIDGVPVTVLGVTPADFAGTVSERVDLWLPLSAAAVFRPNERWVREELAVDARPRVSGVLAVAGRLAAGATAAQAQAELDVLAARFDPAARGGRGVRLFGTAGADGPRGIDTAPFTRMFGAVMAVLLLACANVGNLLLARAGARRREIAVRLSVGASRPRLIRQLLIESVTLALAAGVAGTYLALHLPRLVLEAATGQRTALQLHPDGPVLAYTLAVCVLASLLFGLAPAFHATRGSVSAALKDSAPVLPGTRFSLRSLLLSLQVALSVVLLVGAGLLIRGVQRGYGLDHGFRIEGISVMSFEPPGSVYDASRTRAFTLEFVREIEAMAVEAPVALAHVVPFGSGIIKGSHRLPGSTTDESNTVYEVSAGYFGVLDLPIVAGRVFGPDDAGSRAILVNETLARRFGSVKAAVGQTIASSPDPGWNLPGDLPIVGVVRDANRTALEDVQPTIYQPVSGRTIPQVLVRDAPGATERIAAVTARLDPRVGVRTAALSQNIESRLQSSRTAATIATALGVLALALASVGMFGVFGFWVQQRTGEIGIRMALGAQGLQVVQLVLDSSAQAIGMGLALGLAGSVVAANLLRSSLFGLSPLDPVAYGGVVLVLVVASLAATFFPARRATRVDPVVALRCE